MKNRILLLCAVALLSSSAAFAVSESEPNDDRSNANAIGSIPTSLIGGFPSGFGNGASDDYWSFTAVAGSTYSFAGSGGNGINPLDLGFEIWAAVGGSPLTFEDDLGDNAGENLSWVAPSSGTFYFVVYEATGNVNGTANYTVNVSVASDVQDWILY